jgi:hypothetical protein
MRVYEVTVTVDLQFAESFERFMRETHIPDVLGTGRFTVARFARSADRYKIEYETDDLEAYLRNEAGRLREDFIRHFPSGVRVEHEVREVIDTWSAGSAN